MAGAAASGPGLADVALFSLLESEAEEEDAELGLDRDDHHFDYEDNELEEGDEEGDEEDEDEDEEEGDLQSQPAARSQRLRFTELEPMLRMGVRLDSETASQPLDRDAGIRLATAAAATVTHTASARELTQRGLEN